MDNLVCVLAKDKMYIGEIDINAEDADVLQQTVIELSNALLINEFFMPSQDGQMHRAASFAPIIPFDKTSHSIVITDSAGFINVEEGSDTEKGYLSFLNFLREQNSNIKIASAIPSANNVSQFTGKFGPSR